jgi:FKBP-type peptidyl-prolyl cis-trans isomerase
MLLVLSAACGCGDPIITQVTPPGVEVRPVIAEADAAEALGEQGLRGTVQAEGGSTTAFQIDPAPPTEPGVEASKRSGLKYTTVKAGSGAEAKPGQVVRVHYVGTLADGREFDSSRRRGTPYEFQIGLSQVIQGWHEGIVGMKVGEVRRLTVPPALGYGAEGKDSIPPNSTLLFEIELMDVR